MGRAMVLAMAGAFFAAGCRSDLSQQLLERELRMQEDQIYQLQDQLQEKCARLDSVAVENRSLRRQLGFADGDAAAPGRGSPPARLPAAPSAAEPILVPPAIDLPGGTAPRSPGGPPAPGSIAPPQLDGVPPLPVEPKFSGSPAPPLSGTARAAAGNVVPAGLTVAAADARAIPGPDDPSFDPPVARRLSTEESLAAAGRITHLVVNAARTQCFDGDGDGVSDGLAIVIEPRDSDERLVAAAGDTAISVHGLSGGATATPLARWEIPAPEAAARFRKTSRNRGLHFVLRWPGPPPDDEHVRVHVVLTTFDAAAFEADCTVTTRPRGPVAGP